MPPKIGPLYQVPAAGGTPKPVTSLDPARGEFSHQFPQFLPDNRHFLYYAVSSRLGESSVRIGSLESTNAKFLLNADANAVYAPALDGRHDFLLFVYRGALIAQRFDWQHLELSGERVVVARDVFYAGGRADVSASATGVMAYQGASLKDRQLTWFDREGKPHETVGPPNNYEAWSLSPDERRVAFQDEDPSSPGGNAIWTMDVASGMQSRLTKVSLGFTHLFFPIWSPDGSGILFSAGTDQAWR